MTLTDEPQAVSSGLERARAALRGRAPMLDPHDLDDDVQAHAARHREQVSAMRWGAVIPNRFQWARLEHFADEPWLADLAAWAEEPAGRNLVLLGPVGTGKTHAAVAAVHPSHLRSLEVKFLPVVELLDMLRPGGPEGALYDLADIDRLVVDDLGSERATDWTGERLFALINRRWLEELPTVVTSNLEPDELEQAVGARTFSRLVGNDALVLALKGKDRRRKR